METQTDRQGQLKDSKRTQPEKESLKGTFAAVMIVGGIILLSWFSVFGLFLERA